MRPTLAMVLGSGFQHALADLNVEREIAYGQLPGFPTVGVTGHAGKLVLGCYNKLPVLVLKGRVHYYEGVEMERLTFPVRVGRNRPARRIGRFIIIDSRRTSGYIHSRRRSPGPR